MACAESVVTQMSCCDELTQVVEPAVEMAEFCPMSGGKCRCGVTPQDRTPERKDPLQRSDSQITLGLSKVSVELPTWTPNVSLNGAVATDLVVGLASLRTHNETQALLGIWRI